MDYETKQRMLQWVKPEKKDILLLKLMRGETVDITKDEELFYQINRDRISLDKQLERKKYHPILEHMKDTRDNMTDRGWDRKKTRKYLGDIPADIYFTHPWFSPSLPKHERDANIRKFFKMYPQFAV